MTDTASTLRTTTAWRLYGPCRHCNERPGNRSRNLCLRCYSDYGIRNQYEPKRPANHSKRVKASIAKQEAIGEAASARERGRLAKCKPGELPCHGCPARVLVPKWQYEQCQRLRIYNALCAECKRTVGEKRVGEE